MLNKFTLLTRSDEGGLWRAIAHVVEYRLRLCAKTTVCMQSRKVVELLCGRTSAVPLELVAAVGR